MPQLAYQTTPKPFRLTERDQRIIQWVHYFRWLRTDQILRLTKEDASEEKAVDADGIARPIHRGFNYDALRKRLTKLWRAGYLTRFRPRDENAVRGYGNSPFVYGLGSLSIAPLAEFESEGQLRKIIRNNRDADKASTVRHELLRAEFGICLILASGKDLTIERFDPEDFAYTVTFQVQGENITQRFVVNDVYRITVAGKEPRDFLVEIDCGTENQSPTAMRRTSIGRKMLGHIALLEDKGERDRLGLKRPQLLWITPKNRETRQANMMALYRNLRPQITHSDAQLWLSEALLPLDEPEKLLHDRLFSCAFDNSHGHSLIHHQQG